MYSSTLPSTSAQGGGGWSMPCPGCLTPGKDQVPIVQGSGLAPGLVWTAENLAPPGIRSPDCAVLSELLYRLHYPSPYTAGI